MNDKEIKENYETVIVKIIDYLDSQQSKNNVNEYIPTTIHSNFLDIEPNEAFNKLIKELQQYYNFRALISKEFINELQQNHIYDGILIADLELCKKRIINEEYNKDSYGCIRINDNGIYFEEIINEKRK